MSSSEISAVPFLLDLARRFSVAGALRAGPFGRDRVVFGRAVLAAFGAFVELALTGISGEGVPSFAASGVVIGTPVSWNFF